MPEDQQNEKFGKSVIASEQNPINVRTLLLIIGLLIAAGIGMSFYLYQKGAISLPFLGVNLVVLPTPHPSEKANIEYNFQPACDIEKDGKLISDTALVLGHLKAITLKGMISKITYDEQANSANILLTYEDGTRSVEILGIKEEPNLVAEAQTGTSITLKDLKFSNTILINYNCNPQTNSKPGIVRIQRLFSN